MRLRHIEIFHAVMQCGSVNGAAKVLHITQPAASRLLQQAEQDARLALFRRERGRLVPTQEAQALHLEVDQLFLQIDAIRRLVEGLRLGPDAALQLLCVPSLTDHWLTRALADLKGRFPNARVSLRTSYSRQIAQSLALREADVGFAFEAAQHPALESRVIASGEIVCFGSLPGRDISIEALAAHPVIDLDPGDPLGRLFHSACHAQGVTLKSSMLAHNYHTAIALARQGLGIAVVDSFTGRRAVAQEGARSVNRCVPLNPGLPVHVHAIRPHGAASSAMVDRVVHTMRELLQAA